MQRVYPIIHLILICLVAPWLIGFGYSLCLSNLHHAVVAGFSMIVFSFPVTCLLAAVSWMACRIFSDNINRVYSCFSGLIAGTVMGGALAYILGDEHYCFVILSGAIGTIVGYVEFYLFEAYNDKQEK